MSSATLKEVGITVHTHRGAIVRLIIGIIVTDDGLIQWGRRPQPKHREFWRELRGRIDARSVRSRGCVLKTPLRLACHWEVQKVNMQRLQGAQCTKKFEWCNRWQRGALREVSCRFGRRFLTNRK
jgi:hypothetical protein